MANTRIVHSENNGLEKWRVIEVDEADSVHYRVEHGNKILLWQGWNPGVSHTDPYDYSTYGTLADALEAIRDGRHSLSLADC